MADKKWYSAVDETPDEDVSTQSPSKVETGGWYTSVDEPDVSDTAKTPSATEDAHIPELKRMGVSALDTVLGSVSPLLRSGSMDTLSTLAVSDASSSAVRGGIRKAITDYEAPASILDRLNPVIQGMRVAEPFGKGWLEGAKRPQETFREEFERNYWSDIEKSGGVTDLMNPEKGGFANTPEERAQSRINLETLTTGMGGFGAGLAGTALDLATDPVNWLLGLVGSAPTGIAREAIPATEGLLSASRSGVIAPATKIPLSSKTVGEVVGALRIPDGRSLKDLFNTPIIPKSGAGKLVDELITGKASQAGVLENTGILTSKGVEIVRPVRTLGDIITEKASKSLILNDAMATKQNQIIDDVMPRIIGKTGKTQADIDFRSARIRDAVNEVASNKGAIVDIDEFGNPTVKNPESIEEFLRATQRTRADKWSQIDAVIKEADGEGLKVSTKSMVAKLKEVVDNPTIQDLDPAVARHAQDLIDNLKARKAYTASEAQDALRMLNQRLDSFYKRGSSAYGDVTKAMVDKTLKDELLRAVDNKVAEAGISDNYKTLRQSYGGLAELEKALTRRYTAELRKVNPQAFQIFDMFSAGDLAGGIVRALSGDIVGGVAQVGKAGAQHWFTGWFKRMRNPDVRVKSLFENLDALHRVVPDNAPTINAKFLKNIHDEIATRANAWQVRENPLGTRVGDKGYVSTDLLGGLPAVKTDRFASKSGLLESAQFQADREASRRFVKDSTGVDIDRAHSGVKTIDALMEDSEFQNKNIFEKINIASQAERNIRPQNYKDTSTINTNRKQGGSAMAGVDTIRGCENNCVGCYANKLSSQGEKCHYNPIAQEVKGKIPEGKMLRVGIVGDPATDWAHTANQMKKVIARSKGASADNSIVYTTKLQSIDGFDPEVIKNMQVSVDPLNQDHMRITMKNLLKLKQVAPDANIHLRIRSYASNNPELQASLKEAVDFANKYNFKVLETKMRFPRAIARLLEIDESKYHPVGSVIKANVDTAKQSSGFLSGQIKNGNYLECDPVLKGCKSCGSCPKTIGGVKKNEISSGININDKTQPFTDQILSGKKTIETRNSRSLDPYIGKRVGIIRTGKGDAMLVGYADIGTPKEYASASAFRADDAKHLVLKGSEFDMKGGLKYGYPISNVEKIAPVKIKSKGIVARKIGRGK
jgi:hypothetical protein